MDLVIDQEVFDALDSEEQNPSWEPEENYVVVLVNDELKVNILL